MEKLLPLFLWALFLSAGLTAQPDKNQKFAAAAYLGLNAAQIDGDYYFGYNKTGLRFGLETQYLISPKLYATVGVGFNQMGSRATKSERNDSGGKALALRLTAVEIPLLINYRLGNKTATGKKENYQLFRSCIAQFGVSFTRLTGYRIARTGRTNDLPVSENFVSVENQFEDFDVHLMVGLAIPVSLQTSIMIQHGRSLLGLYRPEVERIEAAVLPLFPYYLTLGVKHAFY